MERIRVVCEKCQVKLDAKPKLIGQTVKCPNCGAAVVVCDSQASPDDITVATAEKVEPTAPVKSGATTPTLKSCLGTLAIFSCLLVLCCGGVPALLGLLGSASAKGTIPGLAAVDVHGNFTNKGFVLEKRLDSVQSEWRCKDSTPKGDLLVEAFGPSPTRITMVRGTYSGDDSGIDKEAAEFLGYVASVPYQGSSPGTARSWVESNIGKNANTSFGGVKFELITNANTRMLLITPP